MDITVSTVTVEDIQFITVQVIQSGKCHSIVLVTMHTEVYLQISNYYSIPAITLAVSFDVPSTSAGSNL